MTAMAGNAQYHIASLLEKMTSADKDYRFMATNDLMGELSKDAIVLDDDSERKVVKMLLRLLEDKNGEVQNLAVKCLATLVRKVKEAQAEVVVDALCANMVGDKEELRDVSSMALKTLILALPPSSASLTANVVRRVTPRLNDALRVEPKSGDLSVKMEALDILADVLCRHGPLTAQFHAALEESLMPLLASSRLAVRKKAMVALGHLVASASAPLFQKVMERLVAQLGAKDSSSASRTYVAASATVCRASSQRFAEWIPKAMRPLMGLLEGSGEDDELREACLAALEAFALRCPKEMTPFVERVSELCADYLTHDPNYHYDEEEEGDGGMEVEDGEEDEEDADEYSDDEDVSWKVRRGAAKALEALVLSRRDLLPSLLHSLGPTLIARFKEREENVKADIFSAYVALLRQANLCLPAGAAEKVVGGAQTNGTTNGVEAMDDDAGAAALAELSPDQRSVVKELGRQIPSLVKALNRQLREKVLRTRQASFGLLTELLRVVPGALSGHLGLVMPGVEAGLKERQANMKLDTLAFLGAAVKSHPPEVVRPFAAQLVPLVATAAQDPFYKVAAEALAVIQSLCGVLDPAASGEQVQRLYAVVSARLCATDIDQEVKEKAIGAAGQLFAVFGASLPKEVAESLPVLQDRLGNEMTRLTTVHCLRAMAESSAPMDLGPILPSAVPLLAEFLRKNQRGLKLGTLHLLQALVSSPRHVAALQSSEAPLGLVLQELPPLIHESDLQLAQLTLKLLSEAVARLGAEVGAAGTVEVALTQVEVLVQSPLLQGPSLSALLAFLTRVATTPGLSSFDVLLAAVSRPVKDPSVVAAPAAGHGVGWNLGLHKQAFLSIAKCVATLGAAVPEKAAKLASDLAKPLAKGCVDGGAQELFSLLALGELGRLCPDVFHTSKIHPDNLIAAAFQSPSEEIKTAASYSLGGLAVGNLEKFLPFILKEINGTGGRQYLLLHALKEVIGSEAVAAEESAAVFRTHIGEIWDVLVSHAKCEEEGTRNVVAECLGKLVRMEPKALLPKLQSFVKDPSWEVRATVVTAVKHTIVDSAQPQLDPLLKAAIPSFLASLTDPDLNVRRVALVTFNSAAHNKASLVRDLLPTLLPALYAETKVRKELVREVEMGPFKHTVDDGLDLRKAAFECMYTLLEKCLERLEVGEFLEQVEEGLKDHHDIKLLSYLMVARLSALCPAQVVQRAGRLVEPLKTTILAKAKQNSVKQEVEKAEELRRSALRALAALQVLRDAEKVAPLADLLATIRADPLLSPLFHLLQKEPTGPADLHSMEH